MRNRLLTKSRNFFIALVVIVFGSSFFRRRSLDPALKRMRIFGSQFEGGGGLIRDSVSYAAILNKPIEFYSIRANRPGVGGLRVEHTISIDAMKRLCRAVVDGNNPASRNLVFRPHAVLDTADEPISQLELDLEGSAAISLVALLPYLLFSHVAPHLPSVKDISLNGVYLTIKGGTLCVKAPSYTYVQQVFIPTMDTIGLSGHVRLDTEYEQGWHTDFVQTRGLMKLWIKPLDTPLPGFQLSKRGRVVKILATGHAPQVEIDQFHEILGKELKYYFSSSEIKSPQETGKKPLISVTTKVSNEPSQYHVLLVAITENPAAYLGHEIVYPQVSGFPDDLGQDPQRKLEHITRSCIKGLKAELRRGNAVDEHMEDILTIYQALAHGWSSVTSTLNAGLVTDQQDLSDDRRFSKSFASVYR